VTTTSPVVTMKQLLEAGVHFGHQTRRWNPKMRPYIFGERNGIYIIDLQKTLEATRVAYEFVRDVVSGGGTLLFVGTKKQAQEPIAREASRVSMPFVNYRWLGGMLTNFQTIRQRILYMMELERMEGSGEMAQLPKKEALHLRRELEKLERNLGGIRLMEKLPDVVFVIDTRKEHIAVTEANKLGVPIVAVVDTNCDPDVIDHVIPGNDDAIRAGDLMCRIIADACEEGRLLAGSSAPAAPSPVSLNEEDVIPQATQTDPGDEITKAAPATGDSLSVAPPSEDEGSLSVAPPSEDEGKVPADPPARADPPGDDKGR
jgi:small subunit ribosomal protein S2